MPIFFLPAHAITPPSITVPRDLLAHLRDSLRVEAGDEIIFADGQGTRYRTEITHSSKQGLTGRILDTFHEPAGQAPAVILGQALLKGEKMDWVIQKATELGVSRIVPLQSRNTIVQLRPERVEAQLARWQRIALEAAQQSEQWRVPAIAHPQPMMEFCTGPSAESVRLLLAERRDGQSLRTVPLPTSANASIVALVGPEGGWTAEEMGLAERSGWLAVTLGQKILRAETAAIVTVGILQHRVGELG
ncbi:16S rRNA (uracil(1498)-N(3))-methyltransferase [Nitrospira sp. NS4]|uniref:16S rRNA (uracil(1498)-N(3))-methyltransferase n=1 Tax=Nitrospira sp. NS4 TaxID=3414498 RepID=UPI003C30DCE9